MDHNEFTAARRKLGLSVSQLALMLGVHDVQVRRMATAPDKESHRPVNGTTERLIKAYLEGYRPKDWPA
jgi:ribosome-binding protein aMBF1 (putative translation factor)